MKLRVNATPAERARMGALGATAVPMGLPEMITSLQNGVIDGTMSGMSIYTNFNLQNVGKTLLETHDTLLVSYRRLEQSLARQTTAGPRQDHRRGSAQTAAMGPSDRGRRSRGAAQGVDRAARRRNCHAAAGRAGRTRETPEADWRRSHQGAIRRSRLSTTRSRRSRRSTEPPNVERPARLTAVRRAGLTTGLR